MQKLLGFVAFIKAMRRQLLLQFSKKTLLLLSEFFHFLFAYFKRKTLTSSVHFEKNKNHVVKFFMMKRGRYNRPFLHISAMAVLAIGIFMSPFLADSYPVFTQGSEISIVSASSVDQSISMESDVFQTKVSQKPRDKIIVYTVEKGDTISTIAKKFSQPNNPISEETIKWANNLTNDYITVGDELKILPVTGLSHKVEKGETVHSIAKKYDTEPQKLVDFPFNEFANAETFTLVEGQLIIVPDGVKPHEKPVFRRQTYIATGPRAVSASGFTWPVQGPVSQFASWYHMALDITSPVGTPIVAGQNGTITKALAGTWDGGYGTNMMIDDGNGNQSLYAHLSGLNVGIGDSVIAGKTIIGWVGLTGRTTGSHLHFEIYKNGAMVNPISYLQ